MQIEMLPNVKKEFPELFTQKGELKKREPKRYRCHCGHEFSKTKLVKLPGITFGVAACDKCSGKGKESDSYSVWKRMVNNQIEQEDFILKTVQKHPSISKEELEILIKGQFKKDTHALGHLVYFGYLKVDDEKRNQHGQIEYTINPKKNLSKRYERIR